MIENNFLAHFDKVNNKIQTIDEHNSNVSKLCGEFALPMFKASAEYIGLNHDIGKYRPNFQKRIKGKSEIKCEHACVGAQEIEIQAVSKSAGKNFKYLAPCFEYCISGHHCGLQDGYSADGNCSGLSNSLEKDTSDIISERKYYEKNLLPPDEENLKELKESICCSDSLDKKEANEEKIEKYSFFTRYLFSCLTDADFIDTEIFYDESAKRGMTGNFEEALKRVNEKLSGFIVDDRNRKVCNARNELLNQAKVNMKDSRISILDMPTGSGKTLCSIKLALEKVIKSKGELKRIIYVIPYTSIIDQTSKKFKEIFGEVLPVLEHHSNYDVDLDLYKTKLSENKDLSEEEIVKLMGRSTENWDAPLIVTTNVQFFESIYGNKSSKLRKLHNMAESMIVFDEVHMIPCQYLKPCIQAVCFLTKYFNSRAIFMSATMPDFTRWIKKYSGEEPDYLIKNKTMFSAFSNCEIINLETVSEDFLEKETDKYESSLVIVNSRNEAVRLYRLSSCKNKFCLSTYMTPNDRLETIDKIHNLLIKKEKIAVFSTSLIEAGVDLDFEAVFREMTGIDSISQSSGRCNREGLRDKGYMHIFKFEGNRNAKGELGTKINIASDILQKFHDVKSPESAKEYYSRLYDTFDIEKNSIYRFQGNENMTKKSIPFKSYAEEFKFIDDLTENIVIPTDENRSSIDLLEFAGKDIYRKLAKDSASVKFYELKKLVEDKKVVKRIGAAWVLLDEHFYSKETGLETNFTPDYVVD